MNITDLVATSAPKKLYTNSEEVATKYGSPMEFHIMWPMKMSDFASLSTLNNLELVEKVLINEDGSKVFTEGKSLTDFSLIKAIASAIWEELGK